MGGAEKKGSGLEKLNMQIAKCPIAMVDSNNNRYYLHYDQVGSLRAVSNENGGIIKDVVYEIFITSYLTLLFQTTPD